ncbi:unnamed protein product [Cylicostephanus goldi]|uniref:DNA mismatch repair protein S5 domain-containing protein n=1 Tax=Cylicostephanus goldi TaxID=71465 RepID=A0A3P7MNA0_CYLGO|nr:unnamed protein product [Cylicostephanus goldi]
MNETNQAKKEVFRIEDDVSSRISTAQVIVSLSSAVRQLIDNSLDASAQCIVLEEKFAEIRAKNSGYESVEVIDDGTGIDAGSFESLCRPHSTSKLKGIDDFSTLSTLGFRGEALNALCAIASLTIITRSRSATLGTKLRFDHCGRIVDQSPVARSIGTTVVVENLFETLPVRRKEFEKTAKRDFGRVLTAIQCFALSRPEVKFICSNVIAGKKSQPICTPGKVGVREVVINLFGGRADKNKMVDVVRCVPTEDIALMHGVDPKNTSAYVDIEFTGFVSSCEHGYGRSSTDRQFIYVNQRPVDYSKICRVINEVYQQYNRSQYPTLVLYINVPAAERINTHITNETYEKSSTDAAVNNTEIDAPLASTSSDSRPIKERTPKKAGKLMNLSRKDSVFMEKMERTMDEEEPSTSATASTRKEPTLEGAITLSQCVEQSTTFMRTQQLVC